MSMLMNVANSQGALEMGGRPNKTAISQFTLNFKHRERAVDGRVYGESDTNGPVDKDGWHGIGR